VTEVERKFDVPEGFRMPDLTRIEGTAGVSSPEEHALDATYFDTADLRLAANRVALRRRTGGDDAGWHLKRLRADGDRDEVRVPLGRAVRTVPRVLRNAVAVHVRSASLGPVVRLVTSRTVNRLLDASGAVLVEVALDDVTATVRQADGATATPTRWTELEVELVEGDRRLLDTVCRCVVEAGATPSRSGSKLARALDGRMPRVVARRGPRRRSAGAVLMRYLAAQVALLKEEDPRVRADVEDAVHRMRVAARRLRSALVTFLPLVDQEVTGPVRGELAWLGTVLGDVRDVEVVRDHLGGLVDGQPPELLLGPVAERVASSMGERYGTARARMLRDLDGPRYFALLDSLDSLVDDPPLTAAAAGRADVVVLPLIARTFTRLRKLLARARGERDPHRRDVLLHEARKAAKRARYAGESAVHDHGRRARAWAARMEALQEVLGERQDTIVIRAELLALARQAREAGESSFTYGRLHALEERRAADTEDRLGTVWARARRPSVHRWLAG
jgi:CHAD domain-containing protein